ncbi:Retrotransposon protein [Gossypium australe]|uniref:Retrotransposon protein n=1 Tax=Gossypium australe TaxID=47621 RepID=A0A5B6X3Q8_9ROSI|nr:Retrotransposon protein [Gossypium australe]
MNTKVEELSKEKRFMGKSQASASKKSKKYHDHSTTFMGYFGKERGSQRSNPRSPSPSVTSVGSVGNPKSRCKHYNKYHFGECCMRSGACYNCARALARAYAIRARKDASTPNVITGTFSLFDTDITALIDPDSIHLYICTNLVSIKNLSVDFTEFVVKVSNPMG